MARFCTLSQLGKLPCLEAPVLFEFALDLLDQMSFKSLGSAVFAIRLETTGSEMVQIWMVSVVLRI